MILRRLLAAALLALALVATPMPPVIAQPYESKLFGEMRWRGIGPLRGGRTKAVAGIAGQPDTLFIGVCNGGVWKSGDYGRTWTPIFDDQPTGSIGAVAVAPGNPDVIYVGSGEGLQRPDLSVGDGVYRSADGGRTWTHLGLRDGQQIPRIIVDPRDPNRILVAVLGHPYGPNEERGIFRSTDGGKTFQKVLYKDENTGGSDLEFNPANPDVVYAALWESRQGPWENGAWSGAGGGIYKSTDNGVTWQPLTKGLPAASEGGVVQADLAVAPSDPSRIVASVASARGVGIYRSDDAGESWARITNDARPASRIGGGDLPVPAIHPTNPDIVFMASTVTWKSMDGGKTWTGFRGAPGGDDYQGIWISPEHPDVMLLAADQGAIVTVNGGQTWSSWYNQPTAQLYHVAADNAWPYRVCSGQQESGSACVETRGDTGQITVREWNTVGVDEYGFAAPDPLNPDIVYGGRSVTRYDRRTAQVQSVGPKPTRSPDLRTLRTAPVVFSPVDPRVLYFAGNTLWKTADAGHTWQQISPDLTRKTWEIPANVGKYKDTDTAKPTQRGVIYAVGPSYVDVRRIWAGTDDGLIHVTVDGGLHWTDVTPAAMKPFAKVAAIDAGRFDGQTAYVAVNTLRLDDMRPHIYRTHDGGKTWTHITSGILDTAPVNVVREDPKRKGLLFAGTEREVYVSFDDGEHWQSLRLNMPASSVRDLIVKDDDVVVATHGRGFWILDNITPLRQMDGTVTSGDVFLFRPQDAYRVRWNMNTDTPWPPDEPRMPNPPDGAIIDYVLKADANGPVTIEILDAAGRVIRRYASTDAIERPDPATAAVPLYWYRAGRAVPATTGMHRITWDMHYQALPGGGGRGGLPIAAVPFDTAAPPNAPWVAPGAYTVRLTVDGKSCAQPITVKMDPRVRTTAPGLAEQAALSKALYDGALVAQATLQTLRTLRADVKLAQDRAGQSAVAKSLAAFDQKLAALEGGAGSGFGPGGGGRGGAPGGPDTFASIGASLTSLVSLLQAADATPTTQLVAAVGERRQALASLVATWTALTTTDLAVLNGELAKTDQPVLSLR
ncbi:MAG: glycoside hydrolase [Acidobacteria bacterium]|nr:glycoside hydrolase [Acidobacteriota bacterium]